MDKQSFEQLCKQAARSAPPSVDVALRVGQTLARRSAPLAPADPWADRLLWWLAGGAAASAALAVAVAAYAWRATQDPMIDWVIQEAPVFQ